MYSVQSQRVIRASGPHQAAQARRLIASMTPDPTVIGATASFPEYHGQKIVERVATETFRFGCMVIPEGTVYYLLASRVGFCRFYAAMQVGGVWQISTPDKCTADEYKRRLNAYLVAQK